MPDTGQVDRGGMSCGEYQELISISEDGTLRIAAWGSPVYAAVDAVFQAYQGRYAGLVARDDVTISVAPSCTLEAWQAAIAAFKAITGGSTESLTHPHYALEDLCTGKLQAERLQCSQLLWSLYRALPCRKLAGVLTFMSPSDFAHIQSKGIRLTLSKGSESASDVKEFFESRSKVSRRVRGTPEGCLDVEIELDLKTTSASATEDAVRSNIRSLLAGDDTLLCPAATTTMVEVDGEYHSFLGGVWKHNLDAPVQAQRNQKQMYFLTRDEINKRRGFDRLEGSFLYTIYSSHPRNQPFHLMDRMPRFIVPGTPRDEVCYDRSRTQLSTEARLVRDFSVSRTRRHLHQGGGQQIALDRMVDIQGVLPANATVCHFRLPIQKDFAFFAEYTFSSEAGVELVGPVMTVGDTVVWSESSAWVQIPFLEIGGFFNVLAMSTFGMLLFFSRNVRLCGFW